MVISVLFFSFGGDMPPEADSISPVRGIWFKVKFIHHDHGLLLIWEKKNAQIGVWLHEENGLGNKIGIVFFEHFFIILSDFSLAF